MTDEAADASPAAELPANYFELYKLAVEMADRISARRAVANSFFLTANTALVAILGAQDARWDLAVAGLLVAVVWWSLLRSYRDLNSAKFGVILAMEDRLPVRVFGDEWDRLRPAPRSGPGSHLAPWTRLCKWLSKYRELGRIERLVPWAFAAIYAIEIVRHLVS